MTPPDHVDPLSGLLNREGWEAAVAEESQRLAPGDRTVVVLINLDRLKEINDIYGHERGDLYIAKAAAALRASIRPTDIAARIIGDDFAVILRECPEHAARAIADRLHAEFDRASVAGVCGWATVTEEAGFPAAFRAADEALARGTEGSRRTVHSAVSAASAGG